MTMPLGMEVGLNPGDFVFDGDPALPPQKGGGAPSPIFGPCLLWPNGWMDQDGTWHGGEPWSKPHCARWGTSSSPPEKGQTPNFRPILFRRHELHWLDADDQVRFRVSVQVYKCLHNMAPGYLSTLCQPVSSVPGRRHLRSARRGELDFPRVTLATYGERFHILELSA